MVLNPFVLICSLCVDVESDLNFRRGGLLVVIISTVMVPWKVIEVQQNTAVHSLFAVRTVKAVSPAAPFRPF
jgi:hypothetical protein